MRKVGKIQRGLAVGRGINRVLGFGVQRGLRSVEVKPEDFRRQLADKHALWVPNFSRMQDVPLERLDAIAQRLIQDSELLALAEGAGFGLGYYPYGYYGGYYPYYGDAGVCYSVRRRVMARYGWRIRRVSVCE